MNIGETKTEFMYDCNTEYEIVEVKKLHLNVSAITVSIKDTIIRFGYSYKTIITFSLMGYNIRTEEKFSVSTQKHKGQVLDYGNGFKTLDLPKPLFDYLLQEVLWGNNMTIEGVKNFLKDSNIKKVKVNNLRVRNVFNYLENYEFIPEYGFQDMVKNIIRRRTWTVGTVTVKYVNGDTNCFDVLNDGYAYGSRIYKNLSFLNKMSLDNVIEVY